ncbi:hypothetical protein PVAG01_04245 [Phlyctema vagabunda]|uniref:Zn(2)-C6 fungal-type domain-containing protein n=1 Tax=Phlyctema vagabunda TaxID=108571 RepID=A0ABR4PNP1_9HELO
MLGPLDKRRLKTRCEACAKRKIKCDGGVPCNYCQKKKQTCVQPVPATSSKVIFVNSSLPEKPSSPHIDSRDSLTQRRQQPRITYSVSSQTVETFTHHFFSIFLVNNDFAGGPTLDIDTIVSQFQSNNGLHQAVIAVGALDFARKQSAPSVPSSKAPFIKALSAYRDSVIATQVELTQKTFLRNDATLWTTFFLGMFELMYDVSGEGWVKHILYGTSKVLECRGPRAHLSGSGRSFFLTVRVFEICRSLIYSEPSFLNKPEWRALMEEMWVGDLSCEWHPKEALFDLMLSCSSLATRVWDVIDPDVDIPMSALDSALQSLALEGMTIQTELLQWYPTFIEWAVLHDTPENKARSSLANIYYHAISIFLSGIFDYRHQFDELVTPVIPSPVVEYHVSNILSMTGLALQRTRLGGPLFFFPLRVAGARAKSSKDRETLLRMLKEISERSFIVAGAFDSDLRMLWDEMA